MQMTTDFADLEPHETLLTGQSRDGTGRAADDVDERIFWLVTKRLLPRGRSPDGWTALFLDPRDGRFWELTFPHGSLFGGGPRQLTWVSRTDAEERYGRGVGE